MALLKKRGCAGCQPAGEPLAGEGKASPDPLFFPKRHASYAGILIAFLAVLLLQKHLSETHFHKARHQ